jgi:hypothetical protein
MVMADNLHISSKLAIFKPGKGHVLKNQKHFTATILTRGLNHKTNGEAVIERCTLDTNAGKQ